MKNKYNIILVLIFSFLFFGKLAKSQDTIFKTNNTKIVAKIIEITTDQVKYKKMEFLDGPLYLISKSEVYQINYLNGGKDVFSKTLSENKNKNLLSNNNQIMDTVSRYTLTMNDGTQLRGTILKQTKEDVIFIDNNIGEKTISRTKIKSLVSEFGNTLWVFTLTDGSIITGTIINKTESFTVVKTENLGIINLASSKIKSAKNFDDGTITSSGKIWFKNPNSTRYLFAPSAILLKKGEGYYQNIYGMGNAVHYGITENVTIGGGLTGPLGVYLDAKIGFKLSEKIYIGAGALLGNSFFSINGNNLGVGIGFGVLTFGSIENNVTVGAGYGFINRLGRIESQEKPLFVINGMTRLNKKIAFVTENWIVNLKDNPFGRAHLDNNSSRYDTFFSYAIRYMNEKSTLDAGFINTPALIEEGWFIGIPYIGFVIRFGNYKDN